VSGGHAEGVTFGEAARTYAKIGLNSFGGPAGQIAVMHKVLVDEKKWISDERFLHALNYCMLLPGPEATQLVTYVGWLLHGVRGGLTAGVLFVAPGFVAILALSIAYTTFHGVGVVEGVLFGLKAAVLAIVAEAVVRIGKRVLKNGVMFVIAGAAFVAMFVFRVPFPAIIGAAALIGLVGGRLRPDLFVALKAHGGKAADHGVLLAPARARPSVVGSLGVLAVWLPIWLVPVGVLRLWLGPANVFAAQSLFFSKAAVVTFGGAYAVLAYVAQQAVEVYRWLEPGEMLTGLGMAESTPGPLIMVLQFVGYMGAHRDPGSLPPVVAGVVASVLVAWVTFAPCFLWIFLGAPYLEHVRGKKSLAAALSCITAAVVGVVLNLAVWLAVHTLFRTVEDRSWNGAHYPRPDLATVDAPALVIALVAAVAIFGLKWGVLRTLGVAVVLSVGWTLVAGAAGG
jgi:chromate transporter